MDKKDDILAQLWENPKDLVSKCVKAIRWSISIKKAWGDFCLQSVVLCAWIFLTGFWGLVVHYHVKITTVALDFLLRWASWFDGQLICSVSFPATTEVPRCSDPSWSHSKIMFPAAGVTLASRLSKSWGLYLRLWAILQTSFWNSLDDFTLTFTPLLSLSERLKSSFQMLHFMQQICFSPC